MVTFSTISCFEVHATQAPHEESIGRQDWTAQATLQVPWASRYDLAFDVLSNQREWPYGSHNLKPRAASCTMRPLLSSATQSDQGFVYQDALVTFNYLVPNADGEGNNLIAEEIESATEFITLDHTRFRWAGQFGEPLLADESPGRLNRTVRFKRTYYQVAPPLHVDYLNLPGTSNVASVASSGFGVTFGAQTLVFEDPVVSRTIKTDGSGFALTLQTSFIYRASGWNKFWRAKTQSFASIYLHGGAEYFNYPPASWTNIWI